MTWITKFLQLLGMTPIPQPEPSTFGEAMVEVALQQSRLGVRETSRNQGPGIAPYWGATNYPEGYANREPYCAAFGCWVVLNAINRHYGTASNAPFRRPKSARVLDWTVWANQEDQRDMWETLDPREAKVKRGDIVLFDFNGTASGGTHWGIATSNERQDGTFDTVEANTNAAGSREGDGVYLKHDRTRRHVFAILRYD